MADLRKPKWLLMMIETDTKDFAKETRILFEALNQPLPNKQLLIYWWNALLAYDLIAILNAYNEMSDERAAPTIENVKRWLVAPKKETVKQDLHVKNKDKIPEPANYKLNGDGRDFARKILNSPKGRPMIAINHAKFALGLN